MPVFSGWGDPVGDETAAREISDDLQHLEEYRLREEQRRDRFLALVRWAPGPGTWFPYRRFGRTPGPK